MVQGEILPVSLKKVLNDVSFESKGAERMVNAFDRDVFSHLTSILKRSKINSNDPSIDSLVLLMM